MDIRCEGNVAAQKRAAACAAVAEIEDGMLVGLGTGTTANMAIEALSDRVASGLQVMAVATSFAAAWLAQQAGVPLREFDTLEAVDLAIDGADEIDPQLRAIKGNGGAMLRERIVAAAATRMIAVVDASKQVTKLGNAALPVEVLPFATGFVSRQIEQLGATVAVRMAGAESYRTDQDNFVLDCRFGAIDDPRALAAALSAIPGMLGHGLFLSEIDVAYVGGSDGVIQLTRGAS